MSVTASPARLFATYTQGDGEWLYSHHTRTITVGNPWAFCWALLGSAGTSKRARVNSGMYKHKLYKKGNASQPTLLFNHCAAIRFRVRLCSTRTSFTSRSQLHKTDTERDNLGDFDSCTQASTWQVKIPVRFSLFLLGGERQKGHSTACNPRLCQ